MLYHYTVVLQKKVLEMQQLQNTETIEITIWLIADSNTNVFLLLLFLLFVFLDRDTEILHKSTTELFIQPFIMLSANEHKFEHLQT